ncbi:hypothetical protein AN189_08790 [Loktanella sp. 3ANDIMAR09]|uniref:endonuclease/exonuclease/phosphatase family protein n=1 Tax=Loktanella sp. 3ANDIMAR09 TaxID=1225657 RepID=UPI0006F395AB|nr:endonuclease/exonuclease/phosphatase family protein [Loktanella sp. 3ANDIMAR09]KQI68927.1 hypothetical protein AN189_08790 [Loktanella sp. 3ANDIMAR09]
MRKFLIRVVGTVLFALCAATFLPLLTFDTWWIRFLDFPRLQFLAGLLVSLALFVTLRRAQPSWGTILTLAGIAAIGLQVAKLWPYQPLATKMVASVLRCDADDRLRVLVTNVQVANRNDDSVLDMVRSQDPDVLVVLETSPWWDNALAPLDDQFDHIVREQPESAYYGMHVYSRHPFTQSDMTYPMGVDTPMFDGQIAHPTMPIHLLGVHPRPPHQTNGGQPSTMRDATILHAATRARETSAVSVIAGDFNLAPWEDTAQRALRIGALLDPRAGRGPMNSYMADSDLMRWPLDQVLWQSGPGLLDMTVLPSVGSDHHPVRVDLCLSPLVDARTIPLQDGDLAAAQDTFDAARAIAGPAE